MRLGLALDLGSTHEVASQVARAKSLLKEAEAAGLDSVWLGESYPRQPLPFHLPAPLITLARLSGETTLGLGTGVLLLRAYTPHKLAYEAALLDQLSEGRLTLGVGLGPKKASDQLGKLSLKPNFFDEGIAVLRRAWSQAGRPDKWEMVPRPVQPSGPRILIGGHGPRALDRAVEVGDGFFAATHHSEALLRLRSREYWERKQGQSGEICVTRVCVVRETRAAAEAALGQFAPLIGAYRGWGDWGQNADGTADPSDAGVIVGTPADMAEHLQEYASWGVTRVNLRAAPIGMPLEDVVETLGLIASSTEIGAVID